MGKTLEVFSSTAPGVLPKLFIDNKEVSLLECIIILFEEVERLEELVDIKPEVTNE